MAAPIAHIIPSPARLSPRAPNRLHGCFCASCQDDARLSIDPASFIHALQNHDELTLELVHFWTLHAKDTYTFGGHAWTGETLREHLRATMYERLAGDNAPYNLRFVTNGVSCTTASVIAAALKIRDLNTLTEEQKRQIQRVHLLLVMYNAFQPGVFALSGWDLVGALPLPADASPSSWPRATPAGSSAVRMIWSTCTPTPPPPKRDCPKHRRCTARLTSNLSGPTHSPANCKGCWHSSSTPTHPQTSPEAKSPVCWLWFTCYDGKGNHERGFKFGATPIDETIMLPNLQPGPVVDMIHETIDSDLLDGGKLRITLDGYEGKSLHISSSLPASA